MIDNCVIWLQKVADYSGDHGSDGEGVCDVHEGDSDGVVVTVR